MKLMDVTVRESVYYGSGIDYKEALEYLERLDDYISNKDIEYIEICYINNLEKGHLNYDGEYIKKAYDICKGKYKIVGMMHPDKADMRIWDRDAIKLLSMVRIVCGGNEIPANVKDFINYFHELNVEVSINISFALRKSLELNEKLCKQCIEFGADYVYFADSSGSALTSDIEDLCNILNKLKQTNKTGFHLHDHLSLSFANALVVYKNNIDITDVSITGAGRGGGNLKTEFMIPYIKHINNEKLNPELFHKLLNYIEFFNGLINRDGSIYKQLFLDSLSGIFKLALKQQDDIEKMANGDGHKYIDLVFESVGM